MDYIKDLMVKIFVSQRMMKDRSIMIQRPNIIIICFRWKKHKPTRDEDRHTKQIGRRHRKPKTEVTETASNNTEKRKLRKKRERK